MPGAADRTTASNFRCPVAAKHFGLELVELERAEHAEDSRFPGVPSGGRISETRKGSASCIGRTAE